MKNNLEKFGDFFQKLRLSLNKSLRKFCSENNFDPSNISKMERGLIKPSIDNLDDYANALEMKEDSAEYKKFIDLAYLCKGEIPPEVISNEKVLNTLPIFFRTARGERINDEELNNLIETIKNA